MSFIEDAIRTKSPNFYRESVDEEYIISTLEQFIYLGNRLDEIKKTLFYNKDTTAKIQPNGKLYNFLPEQSQEDVDLIHAILGCATESTEMVEALLGKVKYQEPIDKVNLAEEMGDQFWYLAIAANGLCVTFDQIQDKVIAKLKHRYPDAFSNDKANNRDLEGERQILEGNNV